jgi:hypothetical protein
MIAAAPTTNTAFIGASPDGPFYEAQAITAALLGDSPLEQAVSQFFLGGASNAWIVRVPVEGAVLSSALSALDAVPSLNLLAMPDLAALEGNAYQSALALIAAYCASRRAFFLVDPPTDWTNVDAITPQAVSDVASIVKENGAIYWPLLSTGKATTPISGAVAAVYVTTDESRGVWKAPAGTSATLPAVTPSYLANNAENGILNPLGVNVIREFPVYGTVVWGARTLDGADQLASDWKYVSVRRLALFLQSSIIDGLQWTAFQPNTAALWSDITVSVTSFLTTLWKEGAFVGATPSTAFFVQCDSTTTSLDDIENGLVNVIVGFAPVSPAEFVILQITASALPPE